MKKTSPHRTASRWSRRTIEFERICAICASLLTPLISSADELERIFQTPPESARPGVMWMWMGRNISQQSITRDLEALHEADFGRILMFSLSDTTTPWAGEIGNSPHPEVIAWTEPWWKLVRHAVRESKRLGIDFGMFNGPAYETSGGPWVKAEHSMQEICFSQMPVRGPGKARLDLPRPAVDPRAVQSFPVFNPNTGKVEKPEIPERKTFFRDIAVLALPAAGVVPKDMVYDLTGRTEWDAPPGDWVACRFGHTTMGTLIQPAQWKATGFECDKMSSEAVTAHMNHVIGEIKRHLGDLAGDAFTFVHLDSYEAGKPSWTPKMREEFASRRGYDMTPFLPAFAGRTIGSAQETAKFKADFEDTIKDLYRDVHFALTSRMLREADLIFSCEPYGGPWRPDEVAPHVHRVMTEFWTGGGKFAARRDLLETVAALRKSGQNIVEAEAFTGSPHDSKWCETPAWLKPIGDGAYCAGVNRFILHRYVPQPWDDRHRPGNAMGQWGTHFDRTQTWWKPGKAMVQYWQRCQALLQWGTYKGGPGDFEVKAAAPGLRLNAIHRRGDLADVYFAANTDGGASGVATCAFAVSGRQPELWDAVRGTRRILPEFEQRDGKTLIPLLFAPAQSHFVVFRHKADGDPQRGQRNFPALTSLDGIAGPWEVSFDPRWGGPALPVTFSTLEDWTARPEPGIRHYSGTAAYRTSFDGASGSKLELGIVRDLARVRINGRDLGVVWCAPWEVDIPPGLLKPSGNRLEIDITNTWANRLIGDEQEPPDCEWERGHMEAHIREKTGRETPYCGQFLKRFPDWFVRGEPRPSKGRYCFTTWNYFTKDSPLVPSGLLGPVRVMAAAGNTADQPRHRSSELAGKE